jgi:hypothetical protein
VYRLVRRLHTLAGLFNLTAIVVFAATGILMTLPERASPPADVSYADYRPPADWSDKAVADDVFRRLRLPLAAPMPEWAIHRDDNHRLTLAFYDPNGITSATVLEAEHRLRIERTRNPFATFIVGAHETTLYGAGPGIRVRLWAAYMDCAIVSLLFMAASGPWLWLASRPRLRWAQVTFGGAVALFAALWALTR